MNRIPHFTTQSIDWYDGMDEFIFAPTFFQRKLHLISQLVVHYSVIKLRYFWRNYFLNNFRLLIGLLRLVYLLMVGQQVHRATSYHQIVNQHNVARYVGTFSDETNVLQQQFLYCFTQSPNQLPNLNISFLFLQTFLFINSISLF